jgi:ERCC4-type nuclease
MKKIHFQVDVREPQTVFSAMHRLATEKGFTFDRVQLPVGDVVCGEICIERKEAGDFISSIADGRLKDQSTSMHNNFEHNWIVLEGFNLFTSASNMGVNSIIGQQISLSLRKDIHIITVPDTPGFAWAVYGIISKTLDGKKFTPGAGVIMKRGNLTSHDTLTNMLGVIPGVGFARAKTIVADFQLFCMGDLDRLTWDSFHKLRADGKLVRVTESTFKNIMELYRG